MSAPRHSPSRQRKTSSIVLAAALVAIRLNLSCGTITYRLTRRWTSWPIYAELRLSMCPRTSKTHRRTVFSIPPAGTEPPRELRVNVGGGWQSLPVIGAWPYHNTDGEVVAYTCRIEPEPVRRTSSRSGGDRAGGKPATGCRNRWTSRVCYMGRTCWRSGRARWWCLSRVKAAGRCPQAAAVAPGRAAWPGGGKAVAKADWSLLPGRKGDCGRISTSWHRRHASRG